jgi:regulatory protein
MTTKLPVQDKALSLLAKCDRTEYQIRRSLARSGYEDGEIDAAIDFLTEYGYINDASYAEKYLRILIAKGRGRRRAADEMRRHGLRNEIIHEAIMSGYPSETEKELALGTAEKAVSALPADTPRRDALRRVSQKLTTQGYDFDTVSWAIDRAMNGRND